MNNANLDTTDSRDKNTISHVCVRRVHAEEAAGHLREAGYNARIYRRTASACNISVSIWVVVTNAASFQR